MPSESAEAASHAHANDFDARQMVEFERTSRAFGTIRYKVGILPVYRYFIA